MRVARQHADMFALGQALGMKAGSKPADDSIELRPSPAGVAAQNAGLVWKARGGAVQQVGQGLAAQGGVV